MIFERLIFSNILSFAGRNEIVLPPVSKQTSLTIILAPNSAGKTNILRALEFLFYNKTPQVERAHAHKIVNDHHRSSIETGKRCEGFVEARMLVGENEDLNIGGAKNFTALVVQRKFGLPLVTFDFFKHIQIPCTLIVS